VSPVKYELGFYIPEDGILHTHRRENLKSYTLYNLFNWKYIFYFIPFLISLWISFLRIFFAEWSGTVTSRSFAAVALQLIY
jgi:hypothetical protein